MTMTMTVQQTLMKCWNTWERITLLLEHDYSLYVSRNDAKDTSLILCKSLVLRLDTRKWKALTFHNTWQSAVLPILRIEEGQGQNGVHIVNANQNSFSLDYNLHLVTVLNLDISSFSSLPIIGPPLDKDQEATKAMLVLRVFFLTSYLDKVGVPFFPFIFPFECKLVIYSLAVNKLIGLLHHNLNRLDFR